MEWVVTIGKTIEEAKEHALDRLGVAEDDAEFEVLDEPKVGLFGRVRGEARVRARVRPTTPRPKVERRDRRKRSDSASDTPAETTTTATQVGDSPAPATPRRGGSTRRTPAKASGDNGRSAQPKARAPRTASPDVQPAAPSQDRDATKGRDDVSAVQVGEQAKDFLDGLLGAFGLEATTSVAVEGDEIDVQVDGSDLGLLVGPRGSTLLALQDLTRVVAQRRLGDHETRLRVDVGGYRQRRSAALAEFARRIAEQVIADGTPRSLEPMPSADRKVVHDTLAGMGGVVTSSAGEEPYRRVVVTPAPGGDQD